MVRLSVVAWVADAPSFHSSSMVLSPGGSISSFDVLHPVRIMDSVLTMNKTDRHLWLRIGYPGMPDRKTTATRYAGFQ